MQCFGGRKSPAAAAVSGGEANGDGRRRTRDAGSPASGMASTTTSSAAASPVASTISLNREYALAVDTNSYNEIWSKIHHYHTSDEEPSTSPNAHLDLAIDRVLQPDRQSIQEVLRTARPTQLTRLVSDYLDSSEDTSHLFLSLRRSVQRAHTLYAPITQLLDLIPSPPPSRRMSSTQCDWAYDKFQEFLSLDNPFRDTTGSSFDSMRTCFAQLKQQLDHHLHKTRRRHRFLRRATHGSAACLIASVACAAIAGLVIATHALGALVAMPVLSTCLPTRDLMRGRRRRLRDLMMRVDAAARGTYVLDNHLDTIECLVERLHATVESDKELVRLGLERGRGHHRPIEEVLRQLRKNHPSLLLQLRDLDEHVCLCFAAVNRARRLLLQHIHHHAS
ncbi:hypothetical protein J5N97_005524 [Dioscorea zingiberensis]|uniref:Uncharacterized protein n=1 Tax=Dioscorea zingiberensis TaxID=325984 RepID=A0A9D5HSC3_9LILI|nr:hypothetical protein J5N97_005524 [Dioscorea zingiberensis]